MRAPGSRSLRRARPRSDERGHIVFLTLLLLVPIVTIGYVSVNVGVMTSAKTAAQRAADAGALAGCWSLPDELAATAKVQQYAVTLNGAGVQLEQGDTATPSYSSSGAGSLPVGTVDTITVTVTRDQPLLGLKNLSIDPPTITARAACRKQQGIRPMIIALATGGGCDATFRVTGTLNLGEDGSAVANCNPNGVNAQGSSTINGNFLATPSGTISKVGGAQLNIGITTGSVPDPYASLAEPTLPTLSGPALAAPRGVMGCKYTGPPPFGNPPTAAGPKVCSVETDTDFSGAVSPLIFWGGINIAAGADVIFPNNAVVILAGGGADGGLTMQDGATITANQSQIFSTRDPYAGGANANCGPITIQPNGVLALTPPSGSPTPLPILWQDADCVTGATTGCGIGAASADRVTLGGATIGDANTPGAIYTPTAKICNLPANCIPATTMNVLVVSGEIDVAGCMNFSANLDFGSGTLLFGDVLLVE